MVVKIIFHIYREENIFIDSVFLQGNQAAIDDEWNFSDSEF